jgi:uncharacterized repeat protein (TIGR03837 family)
LATLTPSTVWIEAFGCDLPEAFVAHGVAQAGASDLSQPAWINLEYLSAEPWVERSHGLPSPVMSGPARGWVKRFFYPGFTHRTGGLLREHDLMTQQAAFERDAHRARLQNLARQSSVSVEDRAERQMKSAHDPDQSSRLISLFCYEPVGLPELLRAWLPTDQLLVTPGRAMAAVHQACGADDLPAYAQGLPPTDQAGFDRMLWACDLNLVRGEDSLVRALWAGRPFVWQIYPQHDDAHHGKLTAFLDWLDAPPSLRQFSRVWNGITPGPLPRLDTLTLSDWLACVLSARQRLLAQRDLLTHLLDMVRDWPRG